MALVTNDAIEDVSTPSQTAEIKVTKPIFVNFNALAGAIVCTISTFTFGLMMLSGSTMIA